MRTIPAQPVTAPITSREAARQHSVELIAAAALAMSSLSRANAQRHRFLASDTEELVSVASPQISSDDKSIVVMVARPNMKEDGTDSEIVPINIAAGEQRAVRASLEYDYADSRAGH